MARGRKPGSKLSPETLAKVRAKRLATKLSKGSKPLRLFETRGYEMEDDYGLAWSCGRRVMPKRMGEY